MIHKLRNMGRARRQRIQFAGDLEIEGVRIEVKTAMPSSIRDDYQMWQFCVRRAGHTDASYADVLVLIGLDEHHQTEGFWIIPVANLRDDRRKINIPRHATISKWDHFRERWDILEEAIQ